MSTPRVFIGSSGKHLNIAHAIEKGLEKCCARVDVWDEGVFTMGKAFLERLMDILDDYDFAVLVFAADDLTQSKGTTKASPRDNVIFECGLFMGALGRDRVFIVHDDSPDLKIPTDFSGITLASFNSAHVKKKEIDEAVRAACNKIKKEIRRPRYRHVVGRWESRYPLTQARGAPPVNEEVVISPWRSGVRITCKESDKNDYYEAFGRVTAARQLVGEWRSRNDIGDLRGSFILTISPRADLMYGYFTSVDENSGTVYGNWALVKKGRGRMREVKERLAEGLKLLGETTIILGAPPAPAGPARVAPRPAEASPRPAASSRGAR